MLTVFRVEVLGPFGVWFRLMIWNKLRGMTASRASGFFLHCLAVSLIVCLLVHISPTQGPVGVEVTFGPRIGSKYLLCVDRNGLSVKTAVYDPAPIYSLWHFWK